MKKYLLLLGVLSLSSCQDGTLVEEAVLIGTDTNEAATLDNSINKNCLVSTSDAAYDRTRLVIVDPCNSHI